VITRKGAWYSYGGENLAQGRDNTIKLLEEKLELAATLDQLVGQKLEKRAVVSATSSGSLGEEDDYLEED